MNILTFDTEEWFTEKTYENDNHERYKNLDWYLNAILDLLDEQNLKGTFFCVGGLTKDFPYVVKSIAERGHEIGCHSNTHKWLTILNRDELKADTVIAIKALEDVSGQKVISYRAPAYSITENNKWAFEVLAECGIERDASVYPSNRDLGGYFGFPSNKPCIIRIGDYTIKEFPVSLTRIAGKEMAYSGGGYFRFFPTRFIKNTIRHSDYTMTYFHIGDLEHHPYKMMSKEFYESYFKEPGTFKNRFIRMIKHSIGTSGAFDKMCSIVRSIDYVNLSDADCSIDWSTAKVISL